MEKPTTVRARKSPWIETEFVATVEVGGVRARKSPWIETLGSIITNAPEMSGLVRARGLKQTDILDAAVEQLSGLVRARGLKQISKQ